MRVGVDETWNQIGACAVDGPSLFRCCGVGDFGDHTGTDHDVAMCQPLSAGVDRDVVDRSVVHGCVVPSWPLRRASASEVGVDSLVEVVLGGDRWILAGGTLDDGVTVGLSEEGQAVTGSLVFVLTWILHPVEVRW